MKTEFPKEGPASQPRAPHATVAIPSTRKGSRPNIRATAVSTSRCEKTTTPVTVVPRAVTKDATRWYHRRTLRRRKKVFQSSVASLGVATSWALPALMTGEVEAGPEEGGIGGMAVVVAVVVVVGEDDNGEKVLALWPPLSVAAGADLSDGLSVDRLAGWPREEVA